MSDFPVMLSWCPNQSPPDKCDICAPLGTAWPAPYTPNLKSSYTTYPGGDQYTQMVLSIVSNAGGYTESAHDSRGNLIAQRIATFIYVDVSSPSDYYQIWQLTAKYNFSPSPTPGFPPGVTFSVSGSYQWIGWFQPPDAGGYYVLNTDPVTGFF